MDPDPFSYMHQAVWWVLDSNPDFCRLVPERNRIRFFSYSQPEALLHRAEADTPAVFLQLSRIPQAAVIATNTLSALAEFRVQIVATGQNLRPVLEILWTIAKAIENANRNLPAHITAMRFIESELKQDRLSQRLAMFGGGVISVHYTTAWPQEDA